METALDSVLLVLAWVALAVVFLDVEIAYLLAVIWCVLLIAAIVTVLAAGGEHALRKR